MFGVNSSLGELFLVFRVRHARLCQSCRVIERIFVFATIPYTVDRLSKSGSTYVYTLRGI